MDQLELKIPPPLIALMCFVLTWLLASASNGFRTAAIVLALAGLVIMGLAVLAFKQARTTVNPLDPARSSTLVTSNVFAYSRNPMYLGMAILLIAWALWLGSPPGLVGALVFIGWINRFQIVPEERALKQLFGDEFVQYCSTVRRWI